MSGNPDYLFFVNSAALGVGLAMDAFSVSLTNGLHEPRMKRGRMCCIAGVYAVFQYAMPMIGWVCVHTIVELFSQLEKLIPWIALILLAYIGGKMLLEGIRGKNEESDAAKTHELAMGLLIMQGIATSIDALSVGFAIEAYQLAEANAAALIIGAITFVICLGGLAIGKTAGTRLSWKASVLGGIILIAIGIEIFIKGMM